MSAHEHHHRGAPDRVRAAFLLNLCFTILEGVGGALVGSVAIVADAVHDLGDTISLGVALLLEKHAERKPDKRFSYGYRRMSALSALITATVVLVGSVFVIVTAGKRFFEPSEPHGWAMLGLAVFGLGVNGFAAWYLSRGGTHNERMLTWHLLEDVLGWAAVLVGSLLILAFDWVWIDPALAIGIALFVMWNVFRNLAKTVGMFLQQVPTGLDLDDLRKALEDLDRVQGVHDMHAWSLDGEHHVLSCHVVVEDLDNTQEVKNRVRERIGKEGDFHVTIEVEERRDSCQGRS